MKCSRSCWVVPTPVGVNLELDAYDHGRAWGQHARGGEDSFDLRDAPLTLLSPRPWG
ncbi:MAG: hypothetical protein JXA33_11230 [Anaerolineae bacterium]|nr:hypothetical protein [Anaerolineae bacterium]